MMVGDFIQTAERIMVYDKRRPKVLVHGTGPYACISGIHASRCPEFIKILF